MKTESTTTYRSLDQRASAYVASLPADDPLVRADVLIDQANAAVDAGDFDKADHLFAVADALLAGEEL